MVGITVPYPNWKAGGDTDYYQNVHMPMSIAKQGSAMKGQTVEIGINSAPEGTSPPYVAICHFLYESMDAFL